jgi:lipoyl(octanoyl) transferase
MLRDAKVAVLSVSLRLLMKEKEIVLYEDLQNMGYQQAWDYQSLVLKSLVDNKLAHRGEPSKSYPQAHKLLLVEHPHVYTLGRSGSIENLLLNEQELAERRIEFFPINRGGDITYHGPGQLVGYPILDLDCFFTDVHRYVRCIEEIMIRVLAEYQIEAGRIEGYTGVWIENNPMFPKDHPDFYKKRKICAIGVHLSRWVTLHGWAFNVNTDLQYFGYIVPCGIVDEDKTVTSLAQELGRAIDMTEVKERVLRHFEEVFEAEITILTPG